jgi:biopolymer transport protein ExbB
MDTLASLWNQADGVGRAVAVLLLAMSVISWCLILWKLVALPLAWRRLRRGIAAFWSAPDLPAARKRLRQLGAVALLAPLLEAAFTPQAASGLDAAGTATTRLTRRLRTALLGRVEALQTGQVLLASIGSTAPFVGLFGTVWSVQRALASLAAGAAEGGTSAGTGVGVGEGAGAAFTLDQIAGPVGEALVMTAAGLAVAVPAVLAYNLFGRWVVRCESALEGLAHDLLAAVDASADATAPTRLQPPTSP